jgi:RNA polymerase sigma-70 factor (ECF subfamily)
MLEDERKFVLKSKAGEAEAFGALYDHYIARIYRFILVRVRQREEAEDLSHRVFLQAWQNIKNYNERGFPFSSWLYRIARNAVVDYYRRAKPFLSLEDSAVPEIIEKADYGERIDSGLRLEKVVEAIRELKPVEQEVIILRFVEDFTVAETASAVKKSQGAVKLIQHRALNRLKNLIDNE